MKSHTYKYFAVMMLTAAGLTLAGCQQTPAPASAPATTTTQAPPPSSSSVESTTSKSTEVKPADPANPDAGSREANQHGIDDCEAEELIAEPYLPEAGFCRRARISAAVAGSTPPAARPPRPPAAAAGGVTASWAVAGAAAAAGPPRPAGATPTSSSGL